MTATDEPTHPCPARHCPRSVPLHLLMCGIHWRLVPHNIRRAVNRAYDDGRGLGSAALLAAQRSAIRVVNERIEETPADA